MTLRRSKPPERRQKILIIDATSLFRKGRAQNFLDPEHAEKIVDWVQTFQNVENRARVVTLAEIEREDWTLNISRYVLPPIAYDIPSLPEALSAYRKTLTYLRAAEDSLCEEINEGRWLV